MWADFARRVAVDYRVIVPTHPGFAIEGRPAWLETMDDLVLHYSVLLDALPADRVHLVGHSLGGWIAAELASRYPARFASVQLVSATGIFLENAPIADNFLWSPEETIDNLVFDSSLAAALKARPSTQDDEALRYSRLVTLAKLVWNPRWHNPSLARWLHRISAPTHVIWGEQDRFISPAYADEFAGLISGARVTRLFQCGHAPVIEVAETFETAVRQFIREAA